MCILMYCPSGMNGIISDYVPKGARGASRALLLATTAITAAGLLGMFYVGRLAAVLCGANTN